MTFDATLIQPCGGGWCVKTPNGLEGPLESATDADQYATLLKRVNATRSELAFQENDNT